MAELPLILISRRPELRDALGTALTFANHPGLYLEGPGDLPAALEEPAWALVIDLLSIPPLSPETLEDLCDQVHAEDPGAPIFLLGSGGGPVTSATGALEVGADGFIRVPAPASHIIEAIAGARGEPFPRVPRSLELPGAAAEAHAAPVVAPEDLDETTLATVPNAAGKGAMTLEQEAGTVGRLGGLFDATSEAAAGSAEGRPANDELPADDASGDDEPSALVERVRRLRSQQRRRQTEPPPPEPAASAPEVTERISADELRAALRTSGGAPATAEGPAVAAPDDDVSSALEEALIDTGLEDVDPSVAGGLPLIAEGSGSLEEDEEDLAAAIADMDRGRSDEAPPRGHDEEDDDGEDDAREHTLVTDMDAFLESAVDEAELHVQRLALRAKRRAESLIDQEPISAGDGAPPAPRWDDLDEDEDTAAPPPPRDATAGAAFEPGDVITRPGGAEGPAPIDGLEGPPGGDGEPGDDDEEGAGDTSPTLGAGPGAEPDDTDEPGERDALGRVTGAHGDRAEADGEDAPGVGTVSGAVDNDDEEEAEARGSDEGPPEEEDEDPTTPPGGVAVAARAQPSPHDARGDEPARGEDEEDEEDGPEEEDEGEEDEEDEDIPAEFRAGLDDSDEESELPAPPGDEDLFDEEDTEAGYDAPAAAATPAGPEGDEDLFDDDGEGEGDGGEEGTEPTLDEVAAGFDTERTPPESAALPTAPTASAEAEEPAPGSSEDEEARLAPLPPLRGLTDPELEAAGRASTDDEGGDLLPLALSSSADSTTPLLGPLPALGPGDEPPPDEPAEPARAEEPAGPGAPEDDEGWSDRTAGMHRDPSRTSGLQEPPLDETQDAYAPAEEEKAAAADRLREAEHTVRADLDNQAQERLRAALARQAEIEREDLQRRLEEAEEARRATEETQLRRAEELERQLEEERARSRALEEARERQTANLEGELKQLEEERRRALEQSQQVDDEARSVARSLEEELLRVQAERDRVEEEERGRAEVFKLELDEERRERERLVQDLEELKAQREEDLSRLETELQAREEQARLDAEHAREEGARAATEAAEARLAEALATERAQAAEERAELEARVRAEAEEDARRRIAASVDEARKAAQAEADARTAAIEERVARELLAHRQTEARARAELADRLRREAEEVAAQRLAEEIEATARRVREEAQSDFEEQLIDELTRASERSEKARAELELELRAQAAADTEAKVRAAVSAVEQDAARALEATRAAGEARVKDELERHRDAEALARRSLEEAIRSEEAARARALVEQRVAAARLKAEADARTRVEAEVSQARVRLEEELTQRERTLREELTRQAQEDVEKVRQHLAAEARTELAQRLEAERARLAAVEVEIQERARTELLGRIEEERARAEARVLEMEEQLTAAAQQQLLAELKKQEEEHKKLTALLEERVRAETAEATHRAMQVHIAELEARAQREAEERAREQVEEALRRREEAEARARARLGFASGRFDSTWDGEAPPPAPHEVGSDGWDAGLERARPLYALTFDDEGADAPVEPPPPPVMRALEPESGVFEEGEIAALLYSAHYLEVTGRLDIVHEDGRQRSLFLELGEPVAFYSTLARDRPEEALLRGGLITAARHAELRAAEPQSARRLCATLVEDGALKPQELFTAVRGALIEQVLSVLEWERGAFRYVEERAPAPDRVRLVQRFDALLADGVRRKFDEDRLWRVLGGPTTLLGPDHRAPRLPPLGPGEQAAAELFDGSRSLEDVILEVMAAPAIVLRTALLLISCGAARILARGLPRDPEARVADRARGVAIDRERAQDRLRMAREGDYFSFLGVDLDATGYEVQRAAERLRQRFDPARFTDPAFADTRAWLDEIRQVIDEAVAVLGDDDLRAAYRRNLRSAQTAGRRKRAG